MLSVAGLIYLLLTNQIEIPKIPENKQQKDDMLFRLLPFILSVLFMVAAFFFFSYNRFTWLNISLWSISLGLMIFSFWKQDVDFKNLSKKFSDWQESGYKIKNSSFLLLSILAIIIIIYFHFFRINSVLPEMISDHAEKLLDVLDVLSGKFSIFFTRNTGREPLQFYLIALTSKIFNTGITYLSMKIGTAIFSVLMCIYMYLLGKEIGNKWIGLLAALLMGVSFWSNVLARVALRFILYPAFTAPTLYYFIKGIRSGKPQ